MAWNEEPSRSETYVKACGILKDFIDTSDYDNLHSKLSDENISSIETRLMELDDVHLPQELVRNIINALRSEFELDYDDLVLAGGWMEHLPKMIARNYMLRHFLELGNGLQESKEYFYDATLNTAADDYTGFIDLIVVKIQTLGEKTHFSFSDDDVKDVELYLRAILLLMEYCKDLLDMSSTLRPSLFQMRSRRMEGRIRGVIEMSTFRKNYPKMSELLSEVTSATQNITNDEELKKLQIARNERYKQSKIRLYRYTIRCTEDLNNQLEACDPYDFTHRSDLRKQLEQVQIFQRSFDKDR